MQVERIEKDTIKKYYLIDNNGRTVKMLLMGKINDIIKHI